MPIANYITDGVLLSRRASSLKYRATSGEVALFSLMPFTYLYPSYIIYERLAKRLADSRTKSGPS